MKQVKAIYLLAIIICLAFTACTTNISADPNTTSPPVTDNVPSQTTTSKSHKTIQYVHKTGINQTISFNYPGNYYINDSVPDVYHFTDAPYKQVDQANIHIFNSSASYKTYADAINTAEYNIINSKTETLSNGIKITGTSAPGAAGGISRVQVIYNTKPYPTVIELWGDNSADITTFNLIVETFSLK